MPGPSRIFPNNAARQQAYRRRKREEDRVERQEATSTSVYAYVLQNAVEAARRHGAALAQEVSRSDPWETLRALADHFYDQAGTPVTERPWRK